MTLAGWGDRPRAPVAAVSVTAWQDARLGIRSVAAPIPGSPERAGGGAGVSLSIATTRSFTGEVEISPRGEIDVDTAHEVREAVAAVMADQRPTQINLNLREVSFIDSVGISALVAGFQAAEVGGVKLVVTEPSRFVHRQLWVTGLLGLFGAPEPADGPEPAAADR